MYYKGKRKALPSAKTNREYQLYCEGKTNKDKILPYEKWCLIQRRKFGIF